MPATCCGVPSPTCGRRADHLASAKKFNDPNAEKMRIKPSPAGRPAKPMQAKPRILPEAYRLLEAGYCSGKTHPKSVIATVAFAAAASSSSFLNATDSPIPPAFTSILDVLTH